MTISKTNKPYNFQTRKILWVSSLILDIRLDKASYLEVLRHLAKRGHETCLMAMRSKNVFQNEHSQVRIISIPLRYVPVVSTIMFSLTLFFFLPLYIIISKPDFIVTQANTILGLTSGLFAKFKKVKFILDIRSPPVGTVGFRGFLQNYLFATSITIAKKLFDGITIITPLMKKEVCERFDINPDRVGVWTSGVCTTLFNPKNYVSESMELKRKLGLSGKFIVFYHGVFGTTRGLTETIKAIKILKSAYPNIVFFLLGTGSIVPMLKHLIKREELQNKVIIHNPVDYGEVPKYIGMSDVCIVPLPNHPFWRFQCPLKLLEYLAMEKVVIVTDIPAHRLIIGEEKCGIYTSSVKPTEIEKSIVYAYHNKENFKEWGKTGRRLVEEKYTWEKVARDLENYLLSICDRVGSGAEFGKE